MFVFIQSRRPGDDTNLFIFGKSFPEISTKSNSLLINLNKWFVANKLNLNIDKTCYSAFSNNPPNCNDYSQIDLKFNSANIKKCESVKYLGVGLMISLTGKYILITFTQN